MSQEQNACGTAGGTVTVERLDHLASESCHAISGKANGGELSVITDEIKAVLKRRTADIIKLGGLLCEAKKQVGHGEWLPWLSREFSLSERSSQRYMKVYKLAVKYDTVADLNISPSALYLLVEEDFATSFPAGMRQAIPVVEACIHLSRTKRVGIQDVWECYRVRRNMAREVPSWAAPTPLPGATAAERKEAHERWVNEGKPTFDAAQEAERKRAAQHAAKIALSRFKEECSTWLPRMTLEERKEALRYLTEIVAQQELSFAPTCIEHQPEKSLTLPGKVTVNGHAIKTDDFGPAAKKQVAKALSEGVAA